MARKTKAQLRAMHLTDGQEHEAGTVQTSGTETAEQQVQDDMSVTGLAITTSATTINLPADLNLKDMVLADYTRKIADTINSAVMFVDEKNREIAKMLADIATNKRYTADGFKSVAEYAAKFFGYRKSASYALAAAGEIYLDPAASEELKAFSPYKLAELSKVDRQKVDAAVKDGKIKASDTVKDIRSKAANLSAQSGEGDVEKQYNVSLVTPLRAMWVADEKYIPVYQDAMEHFGVEDVLSIPAEAVIDRIPHNTLDELLNMVEGMYLWTEPKKVTVTALPKLKSKSGKGKKAVSRETLRYCMGDGQSYMVLHFMEWAPPVEEKPIVTAPGAKSLADMTDEELIAEVMRRRAVKEYMDTDPVDIDEEIGEEL